MKKKPAHLPIKMHRTGLALYPSTRFAERLLEALPAAAVMEVKISRRRSLPQLQLYWSVLHAIVDSGATKKYPTPEKLHESLKFSLGFVTELITLDGKVILIPDSIAFDAMSQQDFKVYFDRAMELLARLLGTDPMTLLQEAA